MYGGNTVSSDKYCYEYVDGDDNSWKLPLGVAVTPNGAYAYVTNVGSDTVSVISTCYEHGDGDGNR